MKREIIKVDDNGVSADGETFDMVASPDAIRDGLMVNVPVTLVFPDGRRFDTTEARITPFGQKVIAKQLADEIGESAFTSPEAYRNAKRGGAA